MRNNSKLTEINTAFDPGIGVIADGDVVAKSDEIINAHCEIAGNTSGCGDHDNAKMNAWWLTASFSCTTL